MAPSSWNEQANKDLILSFLAVSNGGAIPKADWSKVHQKMVDLGYSFSKESLK